MVNWLAINERAWVGYDELSRSRRVLSTEAKGQGTANILQITVADVALRVVFLLFLLGL